ncbi:hypothetical protein [uncultured Helicobacter sp.]|uniref:hypothetical protein n=1 Tax=uncultured Helicobacter sp. TaxID=175537 RepID=UPI003753E396
MVVLPQFLESKLGFLHTWEIYGVGIGFGKWAQAIDAGSMIVIPSLFAALIVCVVVRNGIGFLKNMTNITLAISAVLFATAVIKHSFSGYQAAFLYFNF